MLQKLFPTSITCGCSVLGGEYESMILLVLELITIILVNSNHLDMRSISNLLVASCVCVCLCVCLCVCVCVCVWLMLKTISSLAINAFICSVMSHLEVSSRDYLEMTSIRNLA